MHRGLSLVVLLLVTACVGESAASSTTVSPSSSVSLTTPSVTAVSTTSSTSVPVVHEVSWSEAEAEKHVANYLAALADGAYEQAAFSAENNGISADGQLYGESFAEFLQRSCGGGLCAGPYEIFADGPGLVDARTGQALSEVTVVHGPTGAEGTIRLATFEGQLIITDLPPLAGSDKGPSLVEALFGAEPPQRLVVQRFYAFEIWEGGSGEWVTHWFANTAFQVQGDVVVVNDRPTGSARAVSLIDPQHVYQVECPRLMERSDNVLALDQCVADRWHLVDLATSAEVDAPVAFRDRTDGEGIWFDERGGAVVQGVYDAEGNLFELTNLRGVDLLHEGYAGLFSLSADGRHVAYVDHADPESINHFWSPVVVVIDVDNGEERGRWVLEDPVICLEFSDQWLVACEVEDILSLDPASHALTAINIATGVVNRVETRARMFLPG